ncbi:MAG TPA: glycoside hydrolase family 16 protein [Flavobacteriaceae bacterium]|nr:glycoside hydrolase family 16 protein [Flavobacteriaceae bacterium]
MIKSVPYLLFAFVLFASCQKSEEIIFEENFDGTSLNENHWNYELGDGCPNICGWGNNEKQVYTKDNATLRDGYLVITATKDSTLYQSSRITTANKVEFQYGTIEARAKLPLGHGLWPAIWMLGSDIQEIGWPACGEIDIMEYVGRAPHEIHTTLHTTDSHGNSKNTMVTTIEDIEEGFHIYKANWTKDKIEFFIDDSLVYTFSPEIKNDETWPFNKSFYVILNLAIGGNFGGPEVDDSIFPQEFIIDYVRIYKN